MKITIETNYGKVKSEARETKTPGLVIVDTPVLGGIRFRVTHHASGLAIGPLLGTEKEISRMVKALGKLTDWTQSAAELTGTTGLNQRVADVVTVYS